LAYRAGLPLGALLVAVGGISVAGRADVVAALQVSGRVRARESVRVCGRGLVLHICCAVRVRARVWVRGCGARVCGQIAQAKARLLNGQAAQRIGPDLQSLRSCCARALQMRR
jgi:hypothetical protein